ncbi:MAG: RNA-directed DNA polymerase [Alphaproteobacteria bacterium]|nr:RNA-directed DNA polymerase [Alphaproteobacteria bacterium]
MLGVLKKIFAPLFSWLKGGATTGGFPSPIPKAKTITARLLQESYLPNQRPARDELPPIFSSRSFTPTVAKQIVPLLPKKGMGYDAVEYRLTRANGQIRASYLPHPLPYANLVLKIEDNWAEFPDIFNNYHSYIRPRLHPDGRLIVMKYDSWLTKTLKSLRWKLTARYIAHADIANFFPSVYTHSIGWAVVGMQEAKSSKGKAWFDDLDKAYRLTKRNETNGVLIGPATSNIATEVILGKVDDKLSARNYRFYRHIDDYKWYCHTREEAEQFIADLTRFLGYYKLSLNAKKSGIVTLPAPDVEPWVTELRLLTRHLGQRPSSGNVSLFLDKVTEVVLRYGDYNAYKYAATVLKSKKLNKNAKITAFVQLLGLSQFAPNLTGSLISFLPDVSHCKFHNLGEEVIVRLRDSLRYGRSDVVVWLLYMAHRCDEHVPDDLVDAILNQRDCVPSLMLFAIGSPKTKRKVVSVARAAVKSPEIFDAHSQWLLIYELYRIGKLKSVGDDKASFDIMKSENVAFCSLIN